MKNKMNKKGFTLVELIVVIAIMGILMAIIIPSWNNMIRRARDRDASAKAKVLFNAAQTEITRIGVRERSALNIVKTSTDADKISAAQDQLYVDEGEFYFYWDGAHGFKVDASGNAIDASENAANNASLARGINSITGGSGIYKIFVRGYNVESVVYSDMDTSLYKGTYPLTVLTLEDEGFDVDGNIRRRNVQEMDMTIFNLSGT